MSSDSEPRSSNLSPRSSNLSSPTKSTKSSVSDRCDLESTTGSYNDPHWFLSGDGDCGNQIDSDELEFWGKNLVNWQSIWTKSPSARTKDEVKLGKSLRARIDQNGIPNILRGELWPTLVSDSHEQLRGLEDRYRLLVKRPSTWQAEIASDISRTFPAHPKFVNNERGQMELFRVLKAYSIYDPELGYCQGTNFIVATLLVQMPEERAFAVFVCFMYRFGLRAIYINNFDGLTRLLFFIDELLKDGSTKLRKHLVSNDIESSMYAHQWILSWFSSRFPLSLANRVFDILSLNEERSLSVLVRLSVTMLLHYRGDLFECDIDDFIDYFRATLPSKFTHKIGENETTSFFPEVNKFIKSFQKYT